MPSMQDILSKAVKGGGKYVSWDNVEVGSTIGGFISGEGRSEQQTDVNTKQLRTFDDGQPMMQVIIPIQGAPDAGIEGDRGERQLAFRGGFTYESSFKGLVNELRRNKLEGPRIGDYIAVTRLANRKGKGLTAKTHQFAVKYIKVEDFEANGIDASAAPVVEAAPASDPWA